MVVVTFCPFSFTVVVVLVDLVGEVPGLFLVLLFCMLGSGRARFCFIFILIKLGKKIEDLEGKFDLKFAHPKISHVSNKF